MSTVTVIIDNSHILVQYFYQQLCSCGKSSSTFADLQTFVRNNLYRLKFLHSLLFHFKHLKLQNLL